MNNLLFRKARILFVIDNCGYCQIYKQIIETINSKLKFSQRIKVVNCSKLAMFNIIDLPLIESFNKYIEGYPTLFFEGEKKGKPSKIVDLDERIIESIYSRWINHSLQENPSASQLTRNIQVCLLERFRADTLLPDISVDLRDKIVEHVLALSQEKQLNQNLGKHIAQDARRLAHEENPEGLIFDMKPYFKKAVEQALAKWQSGELSAEIADPLTEIMKLNTEQVPLKGELHSQLKIEAVKLLIQQFRADQLDALLKTELQASIKNTFVCLKPTEAETAKGLSMLLDLWHREELAPEEVAYVTTQVMQPWKELLGSLNAAINPMANPITHIQSDKSESVDGKVSHQFH